VSRLAATKLAKCYNGAVQLLKKDVVSLRLVPRTWKLPRAADRSLLSWQGMQKSVIYSSALPCCKSNTIHLNVKKLANERCQFKVRVRDRAMDRV